MYIRKWWKTVLYSSMYRFISSRVFCINSRVFLMYVTSMSQLTRYFLWLMSLDGAHRYPISLTSHRFDLSEQHLSRHPLMNRHAPLLNQRWTVYLCVSGYISTDANKCARQYQSYLDERFRERATIKAASRNETSFKVYSDHESDIIVYLTKLQANTRWCRW